MGAVVWIIKHPTNNLPYLKLLAPGATHWTEKIGEAYQYGSKEEAEGIAVRVSAAFQFCFGKLVVEEFKPFAVKVHAVFERRSKIGRLIKVPGWLRGDPLRGTVYPVITLRDATQYPSQEEAESAAMIYLATAPEHIGDAEVRRITGLYSKSSKIIHRTAKT